MKNRSVLLPAIVLAAAIPPLAADDGPVWIQRRRQPFPAADRATGAALAPSRGIVVVGDVDGRGAAPYVKAVLFDLAGKEVWNIRPWATAPSAASVPGGVVADADGNVYIAVAVGSPAGWETVKVDGRGAVVWRAPYANPSGWDAFPRAMAVDPGGKIAVTGTTHADILTIVYDRDGNVVWSDRYDGPESLEDDPGGAGFDGEGYLYVAGTVNRDPVSPSPTELATLKYDQDGKRLWVARYAGNRDEQIQARAIAVGSDGYATVAGWSIRPGKLYDYVIVQYDPGARQAWDGRLVSDGWQGPASLAQDEDGVYLAAGPYVVSYDFQGNMTFLGWADGTSNFQAIASTGRTVIAAGTVDTGKDTNVVAGEWTYAGENVWSKSIDRAGGQDWLAKGGVAVDADGNAYLAGSSDGGRGDVDFFALKADGDRKDVWSAASGDAITIDDEARAIALDPVGNVLVAGTLADEFGTVKYDAAGAEVWAKHFGTGSPDDGPWAIAAGPGGEACVTGYLARDAVTVVYGPDGTEAWRTLYQGDAVDSGYAIAVVEGGDVIMAGSSQPPTVPGYPDIITVRYDRQGNEVWRARYGTGAHRSRPAAIARDPSGNIFVAGTVGVGEPASDIVVLKYDPRTGEQVWASTFDGGALDRAAAVDIAPMGDIFVGGTTTSAEKSDELVVVRFDPAGNEVWDRRYAKPGKAAGGGLLALDGSDIVVAGWSGVDGGGEGLTVLRYDFDGNLKLEARRDIPPGGREEARALAIDPIGDACLAAAATDAAGATSFLAAAFDRAGKQVWSASLDGPGGANAIAVDGAGNIFVAGAADGDMVTAKYVLTPAGIPFRRGDANADDAIDLTDAVSILAALFLGGDPPPCERAADVDDSGAIDITDPITLLTYLFLAGPPPPEPSAACGPGRTDNPLACAGFPPCGK